MAMIVGMQYRPVLDLDFGRMKSLTAVVGPTPSYTRASTGTYFNSSGVLTTAAINGPRFDHVYNGSAWVSKGLLIEEARTNLLQYSHRLLTAPWSGIAMTITESSGIAPDGANAASKVVPTTANQAHYVHQSITAAAAVYSQSFFAKSSGYDFVQICDGFPGGYYANFNLAIGTVATNSGYTTATIDILGNGWYRCSVKSTLSNNTAETCRLIPMPSNIASRVPSFAGDGTSGILVWNAQVELGSFPTSPIPTTAAVETRSADVCQITGGDFSGFYNQTEGSFAVEFDYLQTLADVRNFPSPFQVTLALDSTGRTAKHVLYGQNDQLANSYAVENVTNQVTLNSAPMSDARGVLRKCAMAYKVNDFALSSMGLAVLTDTAGTVPSGITCMEFLADSTYNVKHSGHIARLRYYNTRLPNAILRFFSGGSGAFQPDNISGLQFWVDASDTTTLYTDSALTTLAINDGDVIGGWKDKSGNARNALQSNGTNKPLLKLNIQNSKSAIRFDGTTKSMYTTASFVTGLYTIFIVAKKDSTSRKFMFCSSGTTTGNFYIDKFQLTGGYLGMLEQTNTNGLYSTVANTSIVCDQMTFKRTSLTGLARHSMRVNQSDQALTTTGTLDPSGGLSFPYIIGAYFVNATALCWDGDFYEILLYDSSLSPSDTLLVEAYLKAKWGTP